MTISARAQLDDLHDRLLVAHDLDDVIGACQRLVTYLRDERSAREDDTALLRLLVREAADHFLNRDSRVDVNDWLRSAEPFLRK